MKLDTVRVENFKSVLDSGTFRIDDLTSLVGKNEAGKTALLQALYKLKPVEAERKDFLDTEYPRLYWSDYQESDEHANVLTTTWTLDDRELDWLADNFGSGVVVGNKLTITKGYSNETNYNLDYAQKPAVEHWVSTSGLFDEEKEAALEQQTISALIKWLGESEPSDRKAALASSMRNVFTTGGLAAQLKEALRDWTPTFVYYDQYYRLPGQVALDQIVAKKNAGTLEFNDRVFIALLALANTDVEEIQGITTSESLIAELESVENRLSREIFTYWSQNKHLKVRFRFDQASPNDPVPLNNGKIFRTRIENTRHAASIGFDERSTGFIWFFSFLVWFSQTKKNLGDNLIVLLDEPGLTLHGKAQGDLLRYFNEKLVPKHQVIYTTHSPFMLDPDRLLSARTVEDMTGPNDEVLGTKVGDRSLSTDADTIFPLRAALGYDITQTLFIGEHSLLVEGPSDLLYLKWASRQLASAKREALDKRWTIAPSGGLGKVAAFVSLFAAGNLHVAVFSDFAEGEKRTVRDLRGSELLQDGHVFTADMFLEDQPEADVEDLLGRDLYVGLVNAAYGLSGKGRLSAKPAKDAPKRVVKEVEGHFKLLPTTVPEFDHFTPAAFLTENWADLKAKLKAEGALDRFEVLFRQLNALL